MLDVCVVVVSGRPVYDSVDPSACLPDRELICPSVRREVPRRSPGSDPHAAVRTFSRVLSQIEQFILEGRGTGDIHF